MTAVDKAAATVIRPQPGPQEKFLSSPADIVVYGGAAGGGKSYALLMEPLRHKDVKGFGAVIFRRTSPQIRNEGGLWDTSELLYPSMGLISRESVLEWENPDNGVTIKFAHMQYEKDKHDWQGSQIPLIGFDELTHFTKSQFLYMLSRNRSMCGVRPYVRGTTNPDADSWVAELIEWWVEQDETSPNWGLPIPERAGVVRWFVHVDDTFHWGDSKEEMEERFPAIPPKSFTFIPARLEDNQILMKQDPGYLGNLLAQSKVERERLLGGNWKIRPAAGLFFQRGWFRIIPAAPRPVKMRVRYWDLAGTEDTEQNENKETEGPAWTSGTLMAITAEGRLVVEHNVRERLSPFGVENLVRNIASQDGDDVWVAVERDPGQAGKHQGAHYARLLKGYKVHITPVPRQSKEERVNQFSAQCEAGNVDVVQGAWNAMWFKELEEFPDGPFKDQVDSSGGAFRFLINPPRTKPKQTGLSHSVFTG